MRRRYRKGFHGCRPPRAGERVRGDLVEPDRPAAAQTEIRAEDLLVPLPHADKGNADATAGYRGRICNRFRIAARVRAFMRADRMVRRRPFQTAAGISSQPALAETILRPPVQSKTRSGLRRCLNSPSGKAMLFRHEPKPSRRLRRPFR